MKATHKRWASCFNDKSWIPTLRQCKKLGIRIIAAGKPGWVCWYGFAFVATPSMIKQLQDWWDTNNVEWFRKCPRGAWHVPDRGEIVPWNETVIGKKLAKVVTS